MDDKSREQRRTAQRDNASKEIMVWNVGLLSRKTALKEAARREWNFEKFFNKAKQLAPSVSREELKEFMASQGIVLKPRPKPSGKVL